METSVKEFRYFFYTQQFADGVRMTLAILLPALVASYINQFDIGLTISLGSLCVSLVDAPGPIIHRKNGMLLCTLSVFLVSLVTTFARLNLYGMGLEVVAFSFFFSMFNIYGTRAASLGNASLLVMILTMDKSVEPAMALQHSLLIMSGGFFYMFISLLAYQIRPYRAPQRALGESIRELSAFLKIKGDFYNTKTDLEDDYKRLVNQQMVVSEKQDIVRELLFKTRQIVNESTMMGRKLVLTFVDTVDLFEDITATYYDYTSLRKNFNDSGILDDIAVLINQMAAELEAIGIAIQTNEPYQTSVDHREALINLKKRIDAFHTQQPHFSNIVLKKILVNLRRMMQRINEMVRYFDTEPLQERKSSRLQHSRFVGHQSLDPTIFWNNLTFHSSVFKHAFRVTIACMIGFIIAKLISTGHHSYWIIMTITFMMKPAYSLTRQRNYERISGTLIGGVIGVMILLFIPNKNVQFAFMVVLMIGTYSFMRVKYFLSVIFMTPYILILFKFLGLDFFNVVQERILDTAIGCVIALLAGYLLFPSWESGQLKNYLVNMLKANEQYLQKVIDILLGKKVSTLDYKLARKEVYVSSANLSAAFQRMLSEPKSKQRNEKEIHQFVVLNHILFSNIATIAATAKNQNEKKYPEEIIRSAKRALMILEESLKKFDATYTPPPLENLSTRFKQIDISRHSADDILLKEQLDFIYKVGHDIKKITATINAA